MEEIMPFAIILIVGIGVLLYARWKKSTGYEEPLWILIVKCIAFIVLSVIFLSSDKLGPVAKILAIVWGSTIVISTTIQIVKRVKS